MRKIIILLLISLLEFVLTNQVQLTDKQTSVNNRELTDHSCISTDSRTHILTYENILIDKNSLDSNENYVLYQNTKDLLVTTKFEKCRRNKNYRCNCALYLRVNDHFPSYAFIDFCLGNPNSTHELKYFDETLLNKNVLTKGNFPLVNCNSTIYENMTNAWQNISKYENYFQCARLANSDCETYLVRGTFNNKVVQVKYDTMCKSSNGYGLHSISIQSNYEGPINSSIGLCGVTRSNCFNSVNITIENYTANDSRVINQNMILATYCSLNSSNYKNLDYDWKLDLSKYTTDYECVIFNYDKTIQTFMGEMVKTNYLTDSNRNIVLYDYKQIIILSAKYRMCKTTDFNEAYYCTCALYLNVNIEKSHYVYIDFCNIKRIRDEDLQFKYYNLENPTEWVADNFTYLNCNETFSDEKNINWSTVSREGYFKCARLESEDSDTFIIDTVETNHNVRTKIELKSNSVTDPFTEITINPAIVSEETSGGMCGKWSRINEIECNFVDKNGECIKLGNTRSIISHWSLSRYFEDDDCIIFDGFFCDDYTNENDDISCDENYDKCHTSTTTSTSTTTTTTIHTTPIHTTLTTPIHTTQTTPTTTIPTTPTTRPTTTTPEPQSLLPSRNRRCGSQNDPHMKSFHERYFEFQREGNYILYELDENLFITASFRPCGYNNARCNCAIFITSNYDRPSTAYIDVCNPPAKYTIDSFDVAENIFGIEKCFEFKASSHAQIFDPTFWKNKRSEIQFRYTPDLYIDCAVISTSTSAGSIQNGIFFYRIYSDLDPKYDTIVEVYLSGAWISYINVYPSLYSFSTVRTKIIYNPVYVLGELTYQPVTVQEYVSTTGGICGRWFQGNPGICDLYYGTGDSDQNCISNGNEQTLNFVNTWIESAYNPGSKAILKATSHKHIESNDLMDRTYNLTKIIESPLVKNFDKEEAEKQCRKNLNFGPNVNITQLNDILENTIEMCTKDLLSTGNIEWIQTHYDVLKEKLLEFVFNDPANFDSNGVILDTTLNNYDIRCINDCSGNGKCIKNHECKLGVVCQNIVYCECNENYGSIDCSVNLLESPIFLFQQTCCDSRKKNCEKLVALGTHFSTNDTLYYKMELIGTGTTFDDSNSYAGKAIIIDKKQFEIEFPFGFLSKIQLNSVVMRVGVTYGKGDYYWQNITFYDSMCRSCQNGIVDGNQLLPGTCISKKGYCRRLKNGQCFDQAPCSSAMDIAFLVHTTSKASELEFIKEKNAIADIVGNLNVGFDKVQVAYLYYSRRLRNTLSLKDQKNKKRQFYVDRIKQLPYLPFLLTPFVKALEMGSQIFSVERANNKVPKVVVLFNDLTSSENLLLINNTANKLKDQGVEIFTVGIGNSIDDFQLKTIASDSSHFLKIPNHIKIYESISDILSNICAIYLKIQLDNEVHIKTGQDEYRYFRIDIDNLDTPYFSIDVQEHSGMVNIYYSFSERNPTFENSENSFKRVVNSKRSATNSYFIQSPPFNKVTLFFSVVGLEEINEISITVRKLDFI